MPTSDSRSSGGPSRSCRPSSSAPTSAPPRNHQSGRTLGLGLRAATALFAHFGVEWEISDATSDELHELTQWVTLQAAATAAARRRSRPRRQHRAGRLVQGLVRPDGKDAHVCWRPGRLTGGVGTVTCEAVRPRSYPRLPGPATTPRRCAQHDADSTAPVERVARPPSRAPCSFRRHRRADLGARAGNASPHVRNRLTRIAGEPGNRGHHAAGEQDQWAAWLKKPVTAIYSAYFRGPWSPHSTRPSPERSIRPRATGCTTRCRTPSAGRTYG